MTFSRRLGASLCRWRMWGLAGILAILSFAVRASGFIDLGYVVTPGGTPLVQVYDDGSRTYLVFSKDLDARTLNQMSRSVMATRDGKMHFAALNISPPNPYIVGVYDQVVLTVGGGRATATYVGSSRQSAAAAARQKTPTVEPGRMSIQKDPVQETEAEDVQPATASGRGLLGRYPILVPAGRVKPESLPSGQPGGQATDAYAGGRGQPAAKQPSSATPPWIEVGKTAPVQKPPAKETPADDGEEMLADETPEAAPPNGGKSAEAAPAGRSVVDSIEVLPNRQVVKVVAKSAQDPLPAVVPVAMAKERAEPAPGPAGSDYKVEYKVMIPFSTGKTTLGKEGEKAMAEVTQIGPIAKEIRIRAPVDSVGNFQSAHGRAAEILKFLVKAGIVRPRISIEAVDGVPDGKVVQAEVDLIIDLGSKVKKVDDSARSEANRQTVR